MNSLFNRILIAADLSSIDSTLFEFTRNLVEKSGVSKVYILHVIPNFLNPSNPDLDFHQKFATNYPVDEKVRDLLKEKADVYFDKNKIDIEVNVVEGMPYQQLLHWAELKEIDLVVIGKKRATEGSGITAKRMVRKTKASVLFVSQTSTTYFESVLVPVDFSIHSAKALRLGFELKKHAPTDFNVAALHITPFLPKDSYYGLTMDQEYVDALLKNATETFGRFIENEQLDETLFTKEVIPARFSNIGRDIQSYAKNHKIDLITIGAKGHSPFDRFLYGSVTEQLVNLPMMIPVLVLR